MREDSKSSRSARIFELFGRDDFSQRKGDRGFRSRVEKTSPSCKRARTVSSSWTLLAAVRTKRHKGSSTWPGPSFVSAWSGDSIGKRWARPRRRSLMPLDKRDKHTFALAPTKAG